MRASLLVLLPWLASAVFAADPTARLTLTPMWDAVRTQAPLSLKAQVGWDSKQLLEGRLQLNGYVNQSQVSGLLTQELAVTMSGHEIPVTIPWPQLPNDTYLFNVNASFLGTRSVYDLTQLDVAVPPYWKRHFVLGVVLPRSTRSASGLSGDDGTENALLNSLRFDTYCLDKDFRKEFQVHPVPVDPTLIPLEPLRLLGFDALLLTNEALVSLRPPQLDAITRWVKGGGSLCVLATDAVPVAARPFLNQVTGCLDGEPTFLFDIAGRPRVTDPRATAYRTFYPGVGQTVVVLKPLDLLSSTWKEASLRLWRFRHAQRKAVLLTGRMDLPSQQRKAINQQAGQFLPNGQLNPNYDPAYGWKFDYSRMHPYSPLDVVDTSRLREILVPGSIRGIPLTTVASLLILCLLAIGPGEMTVLSFLKLRRFTWIVFPLIATSFAWYAMKIAEHHLGSSDSLTAIVLVDIDKAGVPARTTEIELLYAAVEKTIPNTVSGSLWTDLSGPRTLSENDAIAIEEGRAKAKETQPMLQFIGSPPGTYNIAMPIRQWTSRLTRKTTFGPDPESDADPLPTLKWADLDTTAASSTEDPLALATAQVLGVDLEKQTLFVFGPHGRAMCGRASKSPDTNGVPSQVEDPDKRYRAALLAIDQFTSRSEAGVFDLIGRLSTTGSGDFEDLVIYNSNAPRERAIVVISEPTPGRYVALRRAWETGDE